MKPITPLLALTLLAALPAGFVRAQSSPAASSPAKATTTTTTAATPAPTTAASPAARPDIYHVHFAHAAPGKAAQLAESLKKPDPTAAMPDHRIILRHTNGDAWDFVEIQHLGPKVTLDAARPAVPPAERDLSDWHNDTYVNGPPWAEFAKALGIDEGAGKSAVYIVSVHRAIPGHREQLEAELSRQDPGDPAAGNVMLQHLEGSAWTFLTVSRYATWDDFVKSETSGAADYAKGGGGWAKSREHSSYHTDTLADRLVP